MPIRNPVNFFPLLSEHTWYGHHKESSVHLKAKLSLQSIIALWTQLNWYGFHDKRSINFDHKGENSLIGLLNTETLNLLNLCHSALDYNKYRELMSAEWHKL